MMTGLFFGSFNPIHVGHMIIANHMLQNGLSEVWFVVSPHNPLKQKKSLLATSHRLYMTKIAVEDNPRFKVSDIETKLSQPSYTVNTLTHLREKYPNKQFALIMGMDNLLTLHKWKNPEEILKHHTILVYARAGETVNEENNTFLNHPNVKVLETPLMDVSSTYIRNAIAGGRDVRYLVTDTVYKYINEMNFYK